jgi:hypothetical protein
MYALPRDVSTMQPDEEQVVWAQKYIYIRTMNYFISKLTEAPFPKLFLLQ